MRSTVGSWNGAAAICKDSGMPSARLNPQGIASAGAPLMLNGCVMLAPMPWLVRSGSAMSAIVRAAAVISASKRLKAAACSLASAVRQRSAA
jgi:hypothetical protein